MNKYKFTIITVCYNAEKDISKTIKSVLAQSFRGYEYIIKDGMSTDATMDVINSIVSESENIHILSEKDQSIYDAMNIAASRATGEYFFFLNAGDYFCDENVLQRTNSFIELNGADIVYGNVVRVNHGRECVRKYGKICSTNLHFLLGDCICHQAMFAKRELFATKKFDVKYKVCADREWQMFQMKQGATYAPMFFEVAEVLVEGFSKNHVTDLEQETIMCLEQYYKRWSWIYKLILTIKKNKTVANMLRRIEKGIFVRKLK